MGETERVAARQLSLRGVRPPAKVPGYEHEQLLGQGAYGEVWVAVNPNSGRKVAIKFFTRRSGLDWASLAREVDKLRYLFSDRYVVQLFEVGWESDPPYYVMEFMENGSLEDYLRTHRLSVHDAVSYFREIAVALVHAHDKGILHCDLKPGNILLDHDHRPRLADFGQSRLTNEMSPALGTLYYMAPEQADLTAIPDARWDVYALGAVMYCMLTGKPPHYQTGPLAEGNLEVQLAAYRKLILNAPKANAHHKVPGVDSGLATIIDRCLEPSPSKRFPNPQAVLSALDVWKLARVRRPLLFLTGWGFGVLLLVMAAVGTYVFWTSVTTAEEGVTGRALEANQFAARAEAQQMALETEHRWRILEFAATDPQLRKWLAAGPALMNQPEAVGQLDEWLHTQRTKYNHDFRKAAQASVWTALDRGGFIRGMDPPYDQLRNRYFGYRDYFTGRGFNSSERTGPPAAIIAGPHRSLVYRRQSTKTWAVTFSVPVWATPGGKPVGVLTMSIDLKHEESPEGLKRFSTLVDTHPDANGQAGLIVRHPYMTARSPDDDDENLPLYYNKQLVERAGRRPPGWELMPDYQDPVSQEPFGGTWLAAFAPVEVRTGPDQITDTGLIVVVQERRDEVMKPVRDLQWRLTYGAVGAVAFVLLLLTILTAGVMSVFDGSPKSRVTRLLRRWAGLPTSSVGTTELPATVGGKTSRVGETPGTGRTYPNTPAYPSEPKASDG